MAYVYQPSTHSLAQPAPGSRGPQTRRGPWRSVQGYRAIRTPRPPNSSELEQQRSLEQSTQAIPSEAGAVPGHSPPLTASGTLGQAFPISASQRVGHGRLLPQPQRLRSGHRGRAWRFVLLQPAVGQRGETPTGGQEPHWIQNTAEQPGKVARSV